MDSNELDQTAQLEETKELLTKTLTEAGVDKEVVDSSVSDLEAQARAKGWRPDGPKTAKEFLDDEPFYEERKARNKKLKDLEQTVEDLKEQLARQHKIGYQQAMEDLKKQRSDAIALGDEDTVNKLDERINEISQDIPKAPDPLQHPVVIEFAERNAKWLKDTTSIEHIEMQEYFIERDAQLKKYALPIEQHTQILEESMKKKFPTYFSEGDSSNSMVGIVHDSAPTGVVSKKKTYTIRDLSDAQKEVCRRFVRRNIMGEQEYIDSLVKSGDLK